MISVNEALEKMQATVAEAKERLEGNGFTMSTETEYMNAMLKGVTDINRAKFVTIALVISAEGIAEGDEYCMSLGAQLSRGGTDEERLAKDIENFNKMVDEAIAVLEGYDDKTKGLCALTAKANEEYEKLLVKIKEEQDKSRRISRIINIVVIAGIALLFILTMFK